MHTPGRHTCRTGLDKAGRIVLLAVVSCGTFVRPAVFAESPRLRTAQKWVALILVPKGTTWLPAAARPLGGHGAREAS